jgi:uncharacterized protein (TIGR02466 family)
MVAKADSWIERFDAVRLFPTYVWQTQLASRHHRLVDALIVEVLEEKRQNLPSLGPGETWQSDQALHELEALEPLVACINAAATNVLRFLQIGYDAFEITGCWANIHAVGAGHRIHSHPNNFLSGVYYVSTRPGADTINFHDPRAQTGILRPPVMALTSANTDQVVIRVGNGTLLLFPSYLQHSVDANRSNNLRISLGFNLMFSEFTASMSRPLWAPARHSGGETER